MPVGHVGLSRGPRPFPNGFRTGTTTVTPPPEPPPVVTHRSIFLADNRTTSEIDNRTTHVATNARLYDVDNRTTHNA